jgi:hypothetical protein
MTMSTSLHTERRPIELCSVKVIIMFLVIGVPRRWLTSLSLAKELQL